MYDDNQSIEAFKRMHAREVLTEQARHVADPVEDNSLFGSHARGEGRSGLRLVVLGVALIALFAMLLPNSI